MTTINHHHTPDGFNSNYYDAGYYAVRHTTIDPYLAAVLDRHVIAGRKGLRVLDAGCGSGVYVNFMQQRGQDACGIDQSPEAARLSGQIQASALDMPFPKHIFDVVLSVHMIEHLDKNEASAFLKECRRVLKPGGILFVMTPNAMAPGRLIAGKRWFYDPSHINVFSPWRLAKTLGRCGFRNIRNRLPFRFKEIKKTSADTITYYGLDRLFRPVPMAQDVVFWLLYATPLAWIRDVVYMMATTPDRARSVDECGSLKEPFI